MSEQTAFERIALRWHHERYVVLTRAQPSRADQVRAWLDNHLFPYMRAMGCESGGDLTRDQFLGFQDWVADSNRIDLGPAPADPEQTVTVREAIDLTGAAPSTIRRRLKDSTLPNAVQDEQRSWHIPLGDLHAAGLLSRSALRRGPRSLPVNHQQQAEMRSVLAHILIHGQELGEWTLRFDPANAPLKVNQSPAPLRRQLTLGEAAQVAARLHVVHQFALWLMRILGLRKSEAYGLQVQDIIRAEGRMFVLVRRQGGRPHKQFDKTGDVVTAPFKARLKTESSQRMLLVPRPLEQVINTVIDVFHTDANGLVDERARLIPGLRQADVGGAGTFSRVLRDAAQAVGINVSLDPDEALAMQAKDLRADLVTDLAGEDVPASVRKRYAGHVAGDDVHDRRYVRPTATQVRKQLAASDAIERLIAEEIPGSVLMIPTIVSCTTDNQPALAARKTRIDSALSAVGWLRGHVDADGNPMLTSEEVSSLFGVSERQVRQWAKESLTSQQFAAQFDGQRYLFDQAATLRVAQELAGCISVRDLATDLDVDPHALRAVMRREGIVPSKRLPGMLQMLTAPDADRMRTVFRHATQVCARAATYEQCAEELQVTVGLIQPLVDSGLLTLDADRYRGQVMVTRESLAALVARSVVGTRGRAS